MEGLHGSLGLPCLPHFLFFVFKYPYNPLKINFLPLQGIGSSGKGLGLDAVSIKSKVESPWVQTNP
jgi:hypothetical protein